LPEAQSRLPQAQRGTPPTAQRGRCLEPGDTVGEYVIVRLIGEGGFGTVYEATHPVIGKRAAVKLLHAQYSADEQFTSRFVAEARAVNQIHHKNIVDIFSFGDLPDGRHYYVMELLEGAPLDAYLDLRGRLPVEEALPILGAIAKALEAAHTAGLAHRDLKPENVFLELDREGVVHPKLLDFGMAKLLDSGIGATHKTRSQAPIGSPLYMSPEQCRGTPVDARTDVYAFGCVAYRMLSGEVPFDSSTALEVMMAHVSTQPVPPSHHTSKLSADYDEPLLRMLEKTPEARPQTAMAAYESLVAVATKHGLLIDDVPHPATATLRELVATRALPGVDEPLTPNPPGAHRPKRGRLSPSVRIGLALAATSLLGLAGAYYLRRSPASPTSERPAPVPSTQPSMAAIVTAAAPTAMSAPTARTVKLTLRSQPAGAEVFLGDRKLGNTPGPFELVATTDDVTLELRAKGYASAKVAVRLERDQELSVTLAAKRAPVKGPKTPGDLEDPY
jgi:serine/threonine-protein kinase